jgi:hypothetical protein
MESRCFDRFDTETSAGLFVLTVNSALKSGGLTLMEVPADSAPPPPANEEVFPAYWDLIDESDRAAYLTLRQTLSSSTCKHCRHHSNEVNRDILNMIQAFVIRNDADDWKRALVCGICWLQASIAINTRQLRLLVSKCKSSINAMFQNIGYVTVPTTSEYGVAIAQFFPAIKDNFAELRKWTIRAAKTSLVLGTSAATADVLVSAPVIPEIDMNAGQESPK